MDENINDIEIDLKSADDALSKIEQLNDDLVNKNMSSYGKDVLMAQLSKCISAYRVSFERIFCTVSSLKSKCACLEEKINQPQTLENEFREVAKKLNLPISPTTSDGACRNPNIEMPFEDPVPKKDVEFMKEYLRGGDPNEVAVPKDEQLTKKEIEAYTNLDKAYSEDRKIEKKILKEIKKTVKKNKNKSKSKNKKD